MVLCLTVLALACDSGAQSGVTGFETQVEADRPPNILLIIADDLGVDRVAAYEAHPDPGRTPNMDALAARGVMFRNAWANPGCSPTRATILTGQYGFRTGIGIAVHYPTTVYELDPEGASLAKLLEPTHRTAAFGKWHLGGQHLSGARHPQRLGFDHFAGGMKIIPGFANESYFDWEKYIDGVPGQTTVYATTDTVDETLDFVRTTDEPWFVWAAFHAPHAPYHAPPDHLHGYELPDDVTEDIPLTMKAMNEALDTELGRLFESMGEQTLRETIVILVGDNGGTSAATTAPFPTDHAKNTVYEGGLRVPLIVAGPGVVRGATSSALANTTDIFATCLELAGGQPVDGGDSVSLVPYFSEPGRDSLRDWAFAEKFEPNGFNPGFIQRAVRNDRYKLIRRQAPPDPGHQIEMYDLRHDPFEQVDLLQLPPPHDPMVVEARQELLSVLLELVPEPLPQRLEDAGGLASAAPGAPTSPNGATPPPSPLPAPPPWLEIEMDEDEINPRALVLRGGPADARGALFIERAVDTRGSGEYALLKPGIPQVMRLRTDAAGVARLDLPRSHWPLPLRVHALVETGDGPPLESRPLHLAPRPTQAQLEQQGRTRRTREAEAATSGSSDG